MANALKEGLCVLELLLVPCSFSVRPGAGFDSICSAGEREKVVILTLEMHFLWDIIEIMLRFHDLKSCPSAE